MISKILGQQQRTSNLTDCFILLPSLPTCSNELRPMSAVEILATIMALQDGKVLP
jgi:hypothetical protein